MAKRDRNPRRPLEESPEVAAAVEDETSVSQLANGGGPDADVTFVGPDEPQGDFPATDELIGDPFGIGSPGRGEIRTGAEQPWEPEDLATARGQDPTPAHVDRARRDLEREGAEAVEKTVP